MKQLPTIIHLRALRKQWKVSYIKTNDELMLVELPRQEIAIYGKRYTKQAALHLLTRWVKLKAHDHLKQLVTKLNRKVKVKYSEVFIRSHVAQWGNYASDQTITLNYKLIFLPPPLVHYVVIHELCHARYFAHSKEFWAEVAKYDKLWNKKRKALDEADEFIPLWNHRLRPRK